MCTVMALPLEEGGYILAGNRDELLRRARAMPPTRHTAGQRAWLAPQDPDGGGTWTSVNERGLSLSLLNNYAAPMAEPADPISRGQLVNSLCDCEDLVEVRRRLDGWRPRLGQVRPFVLLAVSYGAGETAAMEASWDGRTLTLGSLTLPFWRTSNGADQAKGELLRGPVFDALVAGWPGDASTRDARLLAAFADHRPQRGRFSLCMHAEPFGATLSHTVIRVTNTAAQIRYLAGSPCEGILGPRLDMDRIA